MRILLAFAVVVLLGQAVLAGLGGNAVAVLAWVFAAVATGVLGAIAILQANTIERLLNQQEKAMQMAEEIAAQLKAIPLELLAGGYVQIENHEGGQVVRFPLSMN